MSENFAAALPLFEDIINHPKRDYEAFWKLREDVLKRRKDAKLNKGTILRGMQYYAKHGPLSPFTNILSEAELKSMQPDDLISLLQTLTTYEHRISYYGPADTTTLVKLLNKEHIITGGILIISLKSSNFQESTFSECHVCTIG